MQQPLVVLAAALALAAGPRAQPAGIEHRFAPVLVASGTHANPTNREVVVFERLITVADVPWMRLTFAAADLPAGSYIEVASLRDGTPQRLDAAALAAWNDTSAYFNGDAVYVRLVAAPRTAGVRFATRKVMVGVAPGPDTQSICGPRDDRVPSTDKRVARVVNVGCTAWLISATDCLVSAGHCCARSSHSVVEFNVPPSSSNGAIRHPPPRDQYPVDASSKRFSSSGLGNDWCVFKTLRNTSTGKHAGEVQGAFFRLRTSNPGTGTRLRVTGYGVTSPRDSRSQTRRTHTGPLQSISGTRLCYVVDTTGGNSGSPVVDEASGLAVAVHTHGGCGSFGGCNSGTSVQRAAFRSAIDAACGGPAAAFTTFGAGCRGSDGRTPTVGNVGLPRLGSSYRVDMRNGRPNTPVILFAGQSDETYMGSPLPADLSSIGAPGCTLYISLDWEFFGGTDAAGAAGTGPIAVPNDRSLLGFTVFFQFVVLDAAANTLGGAFSDAGKAVYGR